MSVSPCLWDGEDGLMFAYPTMYQDGCRLLVTYSVLEKRAWLEARTHTRQLLGSSQPFLSLKTPNVSLRKCLG